MNDDPLTVLVAGASGALGSPLTRKLIEAGHDVYGLARSEATAGRLRAAGVAPLRADVLDRDAVLAVAALARPDVIVHAATAIPSRPNPRRIGRDMAATNVLRTIGTANLVAAARQASSRVISESIAFGYIPGPLPDATEDTPLDLGARAGWGEVIAAIAALERTTLTSPGVDGIVLRFGGFYGPGTVFDEGGFMRELVLRRRMPIVGAGTGRQSFIHVDDAAAAVVAALRAAPGVYNIVDDAPSPAHEWIPLLAASLGAEPPRRLPVWLARLLAGDLAVQTMLRQRAASNAKARAVLGWAPAHPDWRLAIASAGPSGSDASSAQARCTGDADPAVTRASSRQILQR